jgi:predicted sulfurtransferase
VGVVVTVSVVVHGATATPLSALYGRTVERMTLQEERESTAAGLFTHEEGAPRITPEELAERLEGPDPPLVLDVRTRSQYERDATQIPGSVRVPPDQVQDWAMRYLADHPDGEPHLRPIVTYCT